LEVFYQGTPNRLTKELRTILKDVLYNELEKIEELLESLDPKERLEFVIITDGLENKNRRDSFDNLPLCTQDESVLELFYKVLFYSTLSLLSPVI